jgi:glucose-6-phosphate 1-epimerase
MPTIDELNKSFAIPGVAQFDEGGGGLPRLVITTPAAEGHVYLHGAHVTHFQPRGTQPVLFLSARSSFEDGKPIRGGVPVIFPWFGPRGDGLPMHGFARTRSWEVEQVRAEGDVAAATFVLRSDGQTRAIFPNDFQLRFTATFAQSLEMKLEVKNTSREPMQFEECLHTYFAIGDVRQIAIAGLGQTDYLDKTLDHKRLTQAEPQLKLAGQVDRVYVGTRTTCVIDDAANPRKITVAKENSDATVVWNPWSDRVHTMADLDPEAWPRFVCVETCNVKEHALTLPPGGTHVMRATISTS